MELTLPEKTCQHCRFSTTAKTSVRPILICNNKQHFQKQWYVCDPGDCCPNFSRAKFPISTGRIDHESRLLPLTKGRFAIVDAEDYPLLNKYKWYASKNGNTYYAVRMHKDKRLRMHRYILDAPNNLLVDHINHNGLDNRKANLRLCTTQQNSHNQRPQKAGTSRYKGVSWNKRMKRWRVSINLNKKCIYLGHFKNEIDAARAYDKKAKVLFKDFACLNFK